MPDSKNLHHLASWSYKWCSGEVRLPGSALCTEDSVVRARLRPGSLDLQTRPHLVLEMYLTLFMWSFIIMDSVGGMKCYVSDGPFGKTLVFLWERVLISNLRTRSLMDLRCERCDADDAPHQTHKHKKRPSLETGRVSL